MLDPLTTRFICRVNATLTGEFSGVYRLTASSGPFPAIWGFDGPRKPGLRIGFCTDGGKDWAICPGSRSGKPIALFLYPTRKRQKCEEWHFDIPAEGQWSEFLREIVCVIHQWRTNYMPELRL